MNGKTLQLCSQIITIHKTQIAQLFVEYFIISTQTKLIAIIEITETIADKAFALIINHKL